METVTENKAPRKKPTAAAAAPLPDRAIPIVVGLQVADLDECATQPRKIFRGIEELAANVAVHGVIEPIVVRASPKTMGRHEIVIGARRTRASKLAGLREIPAMIRVLNDAEVLEIQVVENSQREDVHPLEEADGYRALHETHGYSVEEIAAKCGKPVSTVRQRLKLCALGPEAKRAVYEEKLTLGAALVLARIPHADIQAKAVKEVLSRWCKDDPALTAKDISWEVQGHFLLKLAIAPFNVADASLVAGAPACATCPKRTGNQRELFGALEGTEGDQDDLCTDVKCFDAKKDQAWKNRVAEAESKQQRVLSVKETGKVFSHGGHIVHNADFVDLSAKNYDDPKQRTNKALIGKSDVSIVVARDGHGVIRELVRKDDFRKAVKGSGLRTPDKTRSTMSVAAKKERDAAAKRLEVFRLAVGELVAAADRRDPTETFWRALARGFVRGALSDTRREVCHRREIEMPKGHPSQSEGPLKALLAAAAEMTAGEARGLCVELAATSYRGNIDDEAFKELRAVLGTGAKKSAKAKTKARARA